MHSGVKLALGIGGAAALAAIVYARRAAAAAPELGAVPDGTDSGGDPGAAGDQSAIPDMGGAGVLLASISSVVAAVTGSTRGIRNSNPGNLRTLPPARAWDGQSGDDNGYAIYVDDAHGVRALAHQLLRYQAYGYRTIRDLINHWAPPSENETTAYVNDVSQRLSIDPDAQLDVALHITELVAAIIQHENGQNPYNLADLDTWAHL